MVEVVQRELDRRALRSLLDKKRRQLRALEIELRKIPPNATWWELTKGRKLRSLACRLRREIEGAPYPSHPHCSLPRV